MAEDTSYRAPIEALFRSLTLTLLDNGTSEYCFLARFFEGVDVEGGINEGVGGSALASSTSTSSAVKVQKEDALEIDNDGPFPEESASVQGSDYDDDDDDEATIAIREASGTVVSFSETEKRRLRGRGAIDGLWKQVMEPVLGTYNTFITSILATQPSLISLYIMLKLNDHVLDVLQDRGAASVLQGTFMTFKLKAWPILQKQFDEVTDSVKKVKGEGSSGTYLGSIGGLFGGATQSSTSQNGKEAHEDLLRLMCARYARLYSSMVRLNSSGKEEDVSIFSSLSRLRSEIEHLLVKVDSRLLAGCYETVLGDLGSGPASVSHSRMQSEISHWREAKRIRLGV